jgi:TatD DNase family protein
VSAYNAAYDHNTNELQHLSPALIDIGANLTHESFDVDRDAVMARARAAGVVHQVVTGASLASSRAALELARAAPGLLSATAGVHPHHAAGFEASARDDFLALLAEPEVVAVGECGLDYHRDLSPRATQRTAFLAQLEFAVVTGKPVFLHQRDAHADFAAILADFARSLRGGVAHCFTGGAMELEAYLALGLSIGITGWVCDERRGTAVRDVVARIPADRLMIETDAPYLLPRDLLPKPATRRNEPAFLPHIARVVAALRGQSLLELADASSANARRLFGIKDS